MMVLVIYFNVVAFQLFQFVAYHLPSMFVCSIVVLYLLRSVVRTLFKHLFV